MDSLLGRKEAVLTQHLSGLVCDVPVPIRYQGKGEKLGLLFVCLDTHFSMSGYAIVIKKKRNLECDKHIWLPLLWRLANFSNGSAYEGH